MVLNSMQPAKTASAITSIVVLVAKTSLTPTYSKVTIAAVIITAAVAAAVSANDGKYCFENECCC